MKTNNNDSMVTEYWDFLEDLDTAAKEHDNDLVVLKETTDITGDLLNNEYFEMLHSSYEKNSGHRNKRALTVMLNSAYTQKRIVFCITRDTLRKTMLEDRNSSGTAFSNDHYSNIIAFITKRKYIKEVQKGSFKRPSIYEIVHPQILRFFKDFEIDVDKQREEALKFVSKKRAPTTNQTQDIEEE